MRFLLWVTLLAGTSLLAGCSSQPHWARWAQQQGGVVHDAQQQQRMQRVCDCLRQLEGMGQFEVAVIDSPGVGAYSWPSGQVFVTRGLVERIDDAALTAVVAHELGHLIDHRHLRIATLTGRHPAKDVEFRADAIGCQLLVAANLSPLTMHRMLLELAEADPMQRDALLARASAVSSLCRN